MKGTLKYFLAPKQRCRRLSTPFTTPPHRHPFGSPRTLAWAPPCPTTPPNPRWSPPLLRRPPLRPPSAWCVPTPVFSPCSCRAAFDTPVSQQPVAPSETRRPVAAYHTRLALPPPCEVPLPTIASLSLAHLPLRLRTLSSRTSLLRSSLASPPSLSLSLSPLLTAPRLPPSLGPAPRSPPNHPAHQPVRPSQILNVGGERFETRT